MTGSGSTLSAFDIRLGRPKSQPILDLLAHALKGVPILLISSWFSLFGGQFFGRKAAKRSRTKQLFQSSRASQATEELEERRLLTVIAHNDTYDAVDGQVLNVPAPGVLLNDDLTEQNGSFTFYYDDIAYLGTFLGSVTMQSNGAFSYNPGTGFKSLQSGQFQNDKFSYYIGDSVDGTSSATVTLKVFGVNDQTTGTNLNPTGSYLEDGGEQAVGTTYISVDDPDDGDVLTATLTFDSNAGTLSASSGSFISLNGTLVITGVKDVVNAALSSLQFTPSADYNAEVIITVSVVDGGEDGADLPVMGTITLNGIPVNDAPTFDLPVNADQTVLEDAIGPQIVSNFVTNIGPGPTDESGQIVGVFDVSNDNTSLFSAQPAIDSNGTLTYTLSPNAFGSATVTIKLSDDGGTANGGNDTKVATFNINVTPVNDQPSFTQGDNEIVNEDSGTHSVANWATAINVGEFESDTPIFSIVGNTDPSLFLAGPEVSANGTLSYILAPDAFGTALLTVVLTDTGGTDNEGVNASIPHFFTITVLPVNDPPTFVLGDPVIVYEDSGPHSIPGWATGISAGPGETQNLTFTISTSNDALFSVLPAIDPATGTLTYSLAPDANGSALVYVTLSDDGGTANGGIDTTNTQSFTIIVLPVNDPPQFSLGSQDPVNEDAGLVTVNGFASGMVPGPQTAVDEAGQVLTFAVTNDNNSLFAVQPAIDPVTGTLTYTTNPNANGSAVVTVVLKDNGVSSIGGADSAPQQFTIQINPVNDAPTFTLPVNPDVTVPEDAGLYSVNGFASNIAAGPANESSQVLTFHVSTSDDSKFSVLPAINPATGALTFQTALDVNGDVVITVYLADDGGTSNGGIDRSTTQQFTLHITPVNDAPVAGHDFARTNEDIAVRINVLDNDTDIEADALQVFVNTPSHGVAQVNNNGTPLDFSDDFIEYTPNANYNGTDSFTYLVFDGHGGSAVATVCVVICAVNDAPTFSVVSGVEVNEDSGQNSIPNVASLIKAGPADESGQSLEFMVTNDNQTLFAVQPTIDADGTLIFTPAADAFGTATVQVYLVDNGGTIHGGVDTSTTATFTITINPVNDAPTFTVGPNQTSEEDAGPQCVHGFIATFSAGPENEGSQLVDFIVEHDNLALFSVPPAISPSGTLTYTANPNAYGTATVTVRIHDNGGGNDTSASQTFTITITPTNDAPEGDCLTFSILENSAVNTVVGTATGSDIDDGDVLTFAITGGNTGGAFAINPTTGVITVANPAALDRETTPVFHLQVTVTDSSQATGTAHITINLLNVDEPLVLTLPSDPNTFYARHGLTVIDAAASILDPDGPSVDYRGGTLKVEVTSNTNKNDRLDVYGQNAGPGRISVSGKNINYGDVRIGRITRSSSGGSALIITFNENVTSEAVNALLKVIAFKSTVASFPTDTRTIGFTVAAADSTVLGSASQTMLMSRTAPPRAIQLSGQPIGYESGSAAIRVAPTAIVTGPANLDFDGGRLDVKIAASNSQNRLGIANVGGIVLNGSDVLYNGYVFGKATVSKNSISVTLSSSDATPEAVQALTRAITFATTAENTNLSARVINFKLSDVDGVTTPGSNQTVELLVG